MIQYPIEFHSQTTSEAGIQTPWKSQSENGSSSVSVPPEFNGPGKCLSPEDLYNQALTSCFVGTFKVITENSKLTFANMAVNSRLVMDLDEKKQPIMKEFHLDVRITGASQPERLRLVAEKAFATSFILNSVKTRSYIQLQIS